MKDPGHGTKLNIEGVHMVSSNEKRELILKILEDSLRSVAKDQIQHKLRDVLLQDTCNGKLYKYRSFDRKGYALKNLRNGTLHCAKPASFNDPFDCKIGITLNSLYSTMADKELGLVSDIFSLFLQTLEDESLITQCTPDEQRILCKLLDNEALVRFATEAQGKATTEEEMAEILYAHAKIITDLMQTILADEIFSAPLQMSAAMMPQIMDSITPDGILQISGEDASFEDYAHAVGITEDTDEIGLLIQMAQRNHPDLVKSVDGIQELLADLNRNVTERMSELFLIGCLCTDYKNRLMWSHYADSHKGFCIEYDFSREDEDTLSKLPFPIVYSEERPLIPWKVALDNSKENIEEASAQLTLGLLTKDHAWEYENEWRILIGATENSELKMPPVTCIYLGAAIEEKKREQILKIAKKLKVPVKQMRVDRGTYALHAEAVTENG